MYDHTGKQIKNLAVAVCVVGIIVIIIGCICLWCVIEPLLPRDSMLRQSGFAVCRLLQLSMNCNSYILICRTTAKEKKPSYSRHIHTPTKRRL